MAGTITDILILREKKEDSARGGGGFTVTSVISGALIKNPLVKK